jgi:hypothetical protein
MSELAGESVSTVRPKLNPEVRGGDWIDGGGVG